MSANRTGKTDTLALIMAFEEGELSEHDTLVLFSRLIKSGQAWTLQGFYGRTARQLIDAGLITPKGDIVS